MLRHVPHSSRHIAESARADFLLDGPALARELGESLDTATDLIARVARDAAPRRPAMVVNDLARLVIDPKRFPDSREIRHDHRRIPMTCANTCAAVRNAASLS